MANTEGPIDRWRVYPMTDRNTVIINSAAPIKRTSVEKMTNIQILFLFGLLIGLSVACALGAFVTDMKFADQMSYVPSLNGVRDFFFNILTFLILFNNLIPIR